ncbi:unnamed protein product [Ectocarpus sp. CCAP 1310/34]|nr:unnamed protein product [Ectocarpus sp. CCAP 1310/34]
MEKKKGFVLNRRWGVSTFMKVGTISRRAGNFTSDVLLALLRVVREINRTCQLSDKVKVTVQEAARKVQAEMQKVGICDHVMTRARSLWDQVDKVR